MAVSTFRRFDSTGWHPARLLSAVVMPILLRSACIGGHVTRGVQRLSFAHKRPRNTTFCHTLFRRFGVEASWLPESMRQQLEQMKGWVVRCDAAVASSGAGLQNLEL